VRVFGNASNDDPYINFVFETAGTYYLLVEDENASAGSVDYELEGLFR
jgi:hypothetical protein